MIIQDGKVLLIKRGKEPFKGKWALPGGHVNYNEKVENTAVREAKEETNLDVEPTRLVGVYSDPGRDPRGHYITIMYLCKILGGKVKAGDDAADAKWFTLEDLPEMAFDHRRMIEDATRILK